MTLTVFASGSGGNCLLLCGGGASILIDVGISTRRLTGLLASCGLSLQDIDGVLITHEHSDHISGLKTLLKHTHCPVYAPRTVGAHVCGLVPDCCERLSVITVGETFPIGRMRVRAFHTPHDTPESVGYRVESGAVFAIATDMGCVTEEIRQGLLGADTVLIESNHDENMLRFGPYPVPLKRRILSDHGHLSNANCAALAGELARSGTGTIILGHLSRENNRPDIARAAAEETLAGLPVRLLCAPELGCLEVKVERACLPSD